MRFFRRLLLFALVLILVKDEAGVRARTVAEERATAKARAKLREITKPDYTIYHLSGELLEQVTALAERHPDKLSLEVQELELDGYSAQLQVVTVATGQQTHAINGTDHRIRALLDFGQHGREHITSEVALRLLQMLVGEHPVDDTYATALHQLLPNMVLKIIPMENVNGRRKVEAGDLCERKNGRGVDTNRNWSVDWGKKEKDYDPREEYPGTGPFSEPEAELLRQLAADFKPHLWVNVHSGMEALFMPYDHRKGMPEDGSAAPMTALLQGVNELHLSNKCVVGSGGSSVGYLAHGTATDWMHEELHVPMAFTFEIYGDSAAHDSDCFRMFNPTTREVLERVVSTWATVFIALLLRLPQTLQKVPFRLRPYHAWSTAALPEATEDILASDARQPEERGRLTEQPRLVNGHLRRRVALREGPGMEFGHNFLSAHSILLVCTCCLASLLVLRCIKGRWQWWRWRWQMALAGRKETLV